MAKVLVALWNAQAGLRFAVRLCSEHPYNMSALISFPLPLICLK